METLVPKSCDAPRGVTTFPFPLKDVSSEPSGFVANQGEVIIAPVEAMTGNDDFTVILDRDAPRGPIRDANGCRHYPVAVERGVERTITVETDDQHGEISIANYDNLSVPLNHNTIDNSTDQTNGRS